jgi:putative glutamine amidotransferase
VVKKAGGRDIPIFGICRGMQLINVVFGGNLYQDSTFEKQFLNHTLEGSTVYKKRHPVIIKEESLLYRIIQKKRIMVNTSHHQMVKTVGTGLITSAWSEEDGVVEAIEAADDNFLLCVQWHPELIPDKNSKALFDWLVKSAKEYKLNKD